MLKVACPRSSRFSWRLLSILGMCAAACSPPRLTTDAEADACNGTCEAAIDVSSDIPRDEISDGADAGGPDVLAVDASDTGVRDVVAVDAADGGFPDIDGGVPNLEPATLANVSAILARGRTRGNRGNVVAKLGDSITAHTSFLIPCGNGHDVPALYPGVTDTITYFAAGTVGDGGNSFIRTSLAAAPNWTTHRLLFPDSDGNTPIDIEMRATQAAWALLLIGTNDILLTRLPPAEYHDNLVAIVRLVANTYDAVPVLSTIPYIPASLPDAGPTEAIVEVFNSIVVRVAQEEHVPYVDLWTALNPLRTHGLGVDQLHPSSRGSDQACTFTQDLLTYGYNVRNLITLLRLQELRGR